MLCVLGFLGFANALAMRVNLSVAIVAMTKSSVNGTTSAEFSWPASTQGMMLGCFYWGYVITQIPGGMLVQRFGGKWIYGVGMLIAALFTMLTPWAARRGVWWFVTIRVIQGFGQGVIYPSMHCLLAHWVPPLERTKLAAFVYAGEAQAQHLLLLLT